MSGVLGVIFGAICVIAAIVLLIKRYDTKTVLFGTGLVMTIAALEPLLAFDAFHKSMISDGLIWSICSVMGFSYVMKITEVDKHLVNGLAKILMKARPVLIPGVVICTFLVNISLTSVAGVTAAVGAIFIPLLISVGVNPATAELIMETRGETSQLNDYMVEKTKRILEASALMEGCIYSIKTAGGSSNGQSSKEMIEYVKEAVKYVPEYKKIIENVSFGAGEDYASMMSYVQEHNGIGTYIQAGIDRYAGHHNDYFDFDEKNLIPALQTAAISTYLILKK